MLHNEVYGFVIVFSVFNFNCNVLKIIIHNSYTCLHVVGAW